MRVSNTTSKISYLLECGRDWLSASPTKALLSAADQRRQKENLDRAEALYRSGGFEYCETCGHRLTLLARGSINQVKCPLCSD